MQWEILRTGLPRPHHPGPDRRSQAGHLRLPRRRRGRVPRGDRGGHRAGDAGPQLAQRRAAAARAAAGVPRGLARRPPHQVHPVDVAHPARRLRAPGRRAAAAAGGHPRSHRHRPRRIPGGRRRPARWLPTTWPVTSSGCCSSGARLSLDEMAGAPGGPVAPGDIAVLVHTNKQAGAGPRDARHGRGAGGDHRRRQRVHAPTSRATGWSCCRPWSSRRGARVRTAALTCFVGWTAPAAGRGAATRRSTSSARRLRAWADVLARRGVPALLERMTDEGRLTARLLSARPGASAGSPTCATSPRRCTPRLSRAQLGTAALVEWLQHRILDAAADPSEERVRRLESDAEAVQVVTVPPQQGSGVPRRLRARTDGTATRTTLPDLLRLHRDGVRTHRRRRPVGPALPDNLRVHRHEDAGEDLRHAVRRA